MKIKRAVIQGVSPNAFRPNEPAIVIGTVMVTPSIGLPERLCFHVVYNDLKTDYIPTSSVDDGSYINLGWIDCQV